MRGNENDGLAWLYGVGLVILIAILCGFFAVQESRADVCVRNGYTPVYATHGQGMASVKYCERVIDGRSEVATPDELD